MLKPDPTNHPEMSADQLGEFAKALAEEQAAKDENIEAAEPLAARVRQRCQWSVDVLRQLREAREAEGISLAEMEQRTGIRKSVLSRLENSMAPNPTLATLQRYAEAVGKRLDVSIANATD